MRVAVLGAGGPAGVNTCRALSRAGHEIVGTDGNADHLGWIAEYGQPVHMPEPTVTAVKALQADVILAQPDKLVPWLIYNAPYLDSKTILPEGRTVAECQDKISTGTTWWLNKLRKHPPIEVREPWPDWLHQARDKFGLPLWLRASRGAGAKGAIRVDSLDSAYHWIRFWQSRGADVTWVAEEYLPGRDYAWASLWYRGELVTSFARERLEYIYPHLTPEGLTGTPVIAEVVHDSRVNQAAYEAVLSLTPNAHGFMCVDLREDADGVPRPTEINAGRGFTTLGLWSLWGVNFMDLAVRLAADGRKWALRRPDLPEPGPYNALPKGLRLERHIDIPHRFLTRFETQANSKNFKPLTLCA